MSYIRCLSNPEGLYVWSDGKHANITHHVKRPHSSGRDFKIPHGVFERVLKNWVKWHDTYKFMGAKAEECRVDRKTGEIVPLMGPCNRGCKKVRNGYRPCTKCWKKSFKDSRRSEYKIRLSYKGDFVDMWPVTWEYMTLRFHGKGL